MRLAKDLAVVGMSAFLAALAAGPFVVPGAASAGPEAEALLVPLFEPGPFDAKGVGFTMDFDPETCKPGDKLAATLRAANGCEGEEERQIKIVMHVTPHSSPMSRMMPMPKQVWTAELTVRLARGETKTIPILPEKAIQEGEVVTFSIHADGGGRMLARHAAPAAAA
ncbi:MAG: hypothetical protein ACHQ1G_10425 [Planctomycetota bacterium]